MKILASEWREFLATGFVCIWKNMHLLGIVSVALCRGSPVSKNLLRVFDEVTKMIDERKAMDFSIAFDTDDPMFLIVRNQPCKGQISKVKS